MTALTSHAWAIVREGVQVKRLTTDEDICLLRTHLTTHEPDQLWRF